MKTVRRVGALMLVYAASILAVGADTDSYSAAEQENRNNYQVDVDGVPWAISHPQSKGPTKADIAAHQKEQQRQFQEKNWLMRNYQQELQIHSKDPSLNLYERINSDKDLSKLAGLPSLQMPPLQQLAPFHTGASTSGQATLTLRQDPSVTPSSRPSRPKNFQPLITPFGATEAAGLHNFYSFKSSSPTTSVPFNNGPTPAPSRTNPSDELDSLAIETPGMIAARNDPLLDNKASDLTLDMLPGETIAEAQKHQDKTSPLELPLSSNLARLQKQQSTSLNSPDHAKTAPPVPLNPLIYKDADPTPVKSVPVQSRIADPYDFLNH